MPAIVKVKVMSARDLPIMDRSSELTDAFVELKLGQAFEKTEVCAKTLNPTWNSKWFTFKMEEEDLQEEPLQVRMMDHDTYSAHNAIGKVYIPLSSLANDRSNHNSGILDGWFPIYDTLHGIRGEVRLIVEVEILKDQHRFRQSSCGIMFFTCPETPSCYSIQAIHGFLEELVVNDDPEYKWIDRIRTPRASNEARQRLFSRLTGELQRKIGLKTIEVGGNAVVGYQQYFDLEGDTGIVVRGIGTCVSLIPKLHTATITPPIRLPPNIQASVAEALLGGVVSPKHIRMGFRKTSSSDSDGPSSPTKGGGEGSGSNSIIIPPFPTLDSSIVAVAIGNTVPLQSMASSSEFPFYTLTSLPPGLLRHIGGVVSSHSVKLLDKIEDPDEPEKRDTWWQEVRNEVKAHGQAMRCNAVMGYSESTTICDTLCIFSAIGTAVCISTHHTPPKRQTSPGSSVEEIKTSEEGKETSSSPNQHCGVCHIPYSHNKPPEGRLSNCSICNSNLVPSLILSTAEPSLGAAIRGHGTLLQVRVVQPKRRLKGEENAIFISKQLPFLEYKLYKRLIHKVKLKGMNAVFSLQIQYTVGDTMIIMVATGTGVYLEALPPPSKLVISEKESPRLLSLQEALDRSQKENVALYNLKQPLDIARGNRTSDMPEDEVVADDLNLSTGRLEAYTFEVEDHPLKEEDIMEVISDRPLPKGFYAANSHLVPGISSPSISADSRMITIVTKKNLEPGKQHMEKQCAQFLDSIHQALAFKVRKISPCLLTRIHYHIDLPEDDILQIALTAMVTRMTSRDSTVHKSQSEEMIFPMEDAPGVPSSSGAQDNPSEKNTPDGNKAGSVHITPLPFMCQTYVERYIKIINFFVIRESTSIRESGGLDSFMHLFTLESLAIARAHVAAVGGNALLNFRMNDCVLIEHPHKNQAQCLLNVSGDAAVVCPSYPSATITSATTTTTTTTNVTQTAGSRNLSYPGSMATGNQGGIKVKDVEKDEDNDAEAISSTFS